MTQPHEGVGIPAEPGVAPATPGGLGRDVTTGTTPGRDAFANDVSANNVSAKDVAAERAAGVAGDAKSEAQHVAADAKADGRRVADTAVNEARDVADHAGQEVRGLLHEARGEMSAQAGSQQQRLAELLRSISDELADVLDPQTTDYRRGVVTDLAQQASGRLQGATSWLETREPQDVLDEVARFARRRPGTFLAVAAAAGLVVGRLSRGIADDARDDHRQELPGGPRRPAGVTGGGVAAGRSQGAYVDPMGDPYSSQVTTTPVTTSATPQRVAPPPTASQTLSAEAGTLRPDEAGR